MRLRRMDCEVLRTPNLSLMKSKTYLVDGRHKDCEVRAQLDDKRAESVHDHLPQFIVVILQDANHRVNDSRGMVREVDSV